MMTAAIRSTAIRSTLAVVGLLVALACPAEHAWAKGAKHVILMIADGSGFNSYDAASMYEGKWDASAGKSTQVYDGRGWVKYACTTYPLNLSKTATGKMVQEARLVYQPAKAWASDALEGKVPFAGYKFLLSGATDSAAAGTALATGMKTYDAAINWNNLDQPIAGKTLAEIAKKQGKAVGVVTTVQWTHATPACLGGADSAKRDAYEEIANEMLVRRIWTSSWVPAIPSLMTTASLPKKRRSSSGATPRGGSSRRAVIRPAGG